LDEYKKLSKEYGFIELDGTKDKAEIQEIIRQKVCAALENFSIG